MKQLIECVPNFSEGRDLSIIKQITDTIEGVEGVKLLDVDPGKATNRTVVTFVGEPARPMPYPVLGAENWGPLVEMDDGARARLLSDPPAALEFHHLSDGAQLRIRYRTLPGVSATVVSNSVVLGEGDEAKFDLPAAPDGNELILDLVELGLLKAGSAETAFTLVASASDGFWVEELELTTLMP